MAWTKEKQIAHDLAELEKLKDCGKAINKKLMQVTARIAVMEQYPDLWDEVDLKREEDIRFRYKFVISGLKRKFAALGDKIQLLSGE